MTLSPADGAWFAAAYRAHSDKLFRVCLRLSGGDRDWAMDRMHDTFAQLARDPAVVTDRADPGGWLYRTAVNNCLMALRRGKIWTRVARVVQHGAARWTRPDDGRVQARDALSQLQSALDELPVKQRAVFILVEVEELEQKDVAELMGLSQAQVSRLRAKALSTLRQKQWRDEP